MKKILLILAIITLSCSSDDDNSPATFPYQGNWIGIYSGDDTGTWDINVNSEGIVTGSAYSTVYDEEYQLTGTVSSNGVFAATFGNTSLGGEFNGQMQLNGTTSGSWINTIADPDIGGDFSGNKQ